MKMTLRNLGIASLLLLAQPQFASAHAPSEPPEQARIEAAIVPPVSFEGEDANRLTLEQRRAEIGVQAVSVAVLRNGELSWAHSYGDAVDEDSLFQFASLSKTVAAAGIVALAQERGVGLDDDISGDLKGIDMERFNPAGLPITIRGLLSHTNGATVSGFLGYAVGEPLPTAEQIVEGAAPANSDPVVIRPNPEGEFRYSGGGYTVAQLWAEQVSGEDFASLMHRLVLEPVGMERSLFSMAPPESFPRDNAMRAEMSRGVSVDGGWRLHPELAAASLWSNPKDYLRFVGALMAAMNGDGSKGIAPQVAEAMVTPVGETYGLGIGVREIDGAIRLSHSGSNVGYKSNFMAFPATGDAIVAVTNSEKGWPLVGDIGRTANWVYGWPSEPPMRRQRMVASAEELAAITGDYAEAGKTAVAFTVAPDDGGLSGSTPSGYAFRLVKTGAATFVDPQDGQEGTFAPNAEGRLSVTFGGTTYVKLDK